MPWSDFCGNRTETGKKIDLQTLYGLGVNHDKRNKTGLPAAATLAAMVGGAEDLPIDDRGHRGIAFNVAHCTIANGGLNIQSVLNQRVRDKQGAAVCFEDVILPPNAMPNQGHILVHQSVAPCERCRAGYKQWARNRRCTIIVSADDGYDGAADDSVFVFCPTGLVFFG